MKKRLIVFLLFFLKHKAAFASTWTPQDSTENDVYLQGFTLESSKVNTIFACYTKCEDNILCTSIIMNLTDKTCELKYSTKTRHPEKITERQNMIYMEIRDQLEPLGVRRDEPIKSCKQHKQKYIQAKSGVYWMKFRPDPSSKPLQVFCEMTIDGGGWTLVYSYTFTQFTQFRLNSNNVSPIPNWPVDRSSWTWVPKSSTTPLSESSYSAMDFALWKKIGSEILIKSNITNWVACVEGTGSLVSWLAGTVTCRVVKVITPTCTNIAPDQLSIPSHCGPNLYHGSSYQIFLEGSSRCWPVHDPCSKESATNHLANVLHPGGALYVR